MEIVHVFNLFKVIGEDMYADVIQIFRKKTGSIDYGTVPHNIVTFSLKRRKAENYPTENALDLMVDYSMSLKKKKTLEVCDTLFIVGKHCN